ncbi:MAG TPA: efflux transporter outer membrane subunit [Tepidisphaeraceae bacterium]|jgi:multidrug efflux system outer membrane protein|nr:efflux transporter outer membrane subunit [Tepidisphaeraceae bacterium]
MQAPSCVPATGKVPHRPAVRFPLPVFAALAVAVLSGCEVGPDYKTPEQHMPSRWVAPPTTQASIAVPEPLQVEQWWTTFNDPELDSLVRRAVQSNLNVQLATQRIRQSRATLGIAKAGFWPTIDANGSFTHSFSASSGHSVNTASGAVTTVGAHTADLWQAGFDATWELDIFGGIRRNIESSRATYESSIEDRRDVLVTLLGELATDYVQLRGDQQQVVIAQENLTAQVHSLDVTRRKQQAGTTTGLDVANAEAQVATTRSQIVGFESLAQQQAYAISVLLGEEPANLLEELSPRERIPVAPPVVPVGLPSDLLRRRPDIRRAERQLASQTAQIGVATADLFPKFSLTGDVTVGGHRFQQLGNWGTRFWSFGPSFSWPVFDAGAIWSNIEVQKALQSQALLTYRQTVLTALQDVETSLTAYAQEQQRRAALADAVAADQRAVSIATRLYEQGFADFLNLLVAQQALYTAQNQLVLSDQAVATDLVSLYKALGGGWEIGEAAATQPASAGSQRPD